MVSLPIFLLFEMLGPFVELGGYGWFLRAVYLGAVDRPFAVLFLLMAFLWGFLLSVQSLVLDAIDRPGQRSLRQQLLLGVVALLEGVGYRQLTLWFRIKGVWKFLTGDKAWGEMKRLGLRRAPAPQTPREPPHDAGPAPGQAPARPQPR
jgi:hypothetical protein